MFDHVALRVSDFRAAAAAYKPLLATLAAKTPYEDHELVEWDDFDLSPATASIAVTRGVHVGLVAPDVASIGRFWRAGLEAGFADDGAPGPRPAYGGDYVGGFLRDPDGNSIEACAHGNATLPGHVDHVWLRVRDVAAAREFYAAVAPFTGFGLVVDEPGLARFRGPSASLTLVEGVPVSEGLHVAFPTEEDAAVHDFHAAALAAGGTDHGGPGERPEYHAGYYAAFALDPDGHNVEVVNHHR